MNLKTHKVYRGTLFCPFGPADLYLGCRGYEWYAGGTFIPTDPETAEALIRTGDFYPARIRGYDLAQEPLTSGDLPFRGHPGGIEFNQPDPTGIVSLLGGSVQDDLQQSGDLFSGIPHVDLEAHQVEVQHLLGSHEILVNSHPVPDSGPGLAP